MKAEREKRAQILEAEGSRQSEILRAEGEKQAARAAGRRQARSRVPRSRGARAPGRGRGARRPQMVSQAIANGNVQAINYFVAQKYIEALKEFATSPNQKLFMLPMEVTGVLGSLAGIAELAKDSAGATGPPVAPPPSRRAGRLSDAHRKSIAWACLALALIAAEVMAPGRVHALAGHRRRRGVRDRAAGARAFPCSGRRSPSSRCRFISIAVYRRFFRASDEQQRPAAAQPPRRAVGRPGVRAGVGDRLRPRPASRSATRSGPWSGPDLPAGTRVRVTSADSMTLTVVPAD